MNKYSSLVVLALVLGVVALIYLVVDSIKLNTLALMAFIVLIVLPLVGVAVGLFWLTARGPRIRQPRNEEPPIDASWRELDPPPEYAQLEPPAELPRTRRVTVPITFEHGSNSRAATILTSSATDEHNNRVELECSLNVLQVAAQLLAEGKQPTRSSFNEHGVMSSSEVTSCTTFLRAHGWLKPVPAGSSNTPARWVEGTTAEQLQQFVDTWSTR